MASHINKTVGRDFILENRKLERCAFSSRMFFLRQNHGVLYMLYSSAEICSSSCLFAALIWSFNSMRSWLPSTTHLSYAQQGCGALPAYGLVPHNIWNCIKLVHPSCLRNKAFFFSYGLFTHYLSELPEYSTMTYLTHCKNKCTHFSLIAIFHPVK